MIFHIFFQILPSLPLPPLILKIKLLAEDNFDIPKKLNRILEELEAQERSMKWLSRKTGMTYQTIFEYCHNIRQPNLVKLKIIALALGVKSADLITDR